jgi:hypothetical protein
MSSSRTPEFARRIASTYDALRLGDGYKLRHTLRSLRVVAHAGP